MDDSFNSLEKWHRNEKQVNGGILTSTNIGANQWELPLLEADQVLLTFPLFPHRCEIETGRQPAFIDRNKRFVYTTGLSRIFHSVLIWFGFCVCLLVCVSNGNRSCRPPELTLFVVGRSLPLDFNWKFILFYAFSYYSSELEHEFVVKLFEINTIWVFTPDRRHISKRLGSMEGIIELYWK